MTTEDEDAITTAAEDPRPYFTSARIMTQGRHDVVFVWIRGQRAGEIIVDRGEGPELCERLGVPAAAIVGA